RHVEFLRRPVSRVLSVVQVSERLALVADEYLAGLGQQNVDRLQVIAAALQGDRRLSDATLELPEQYPNLLGPHTALDLLRRTPRFPAAAAGETLCNENP